MARYQIKKDKDGCYYWTLRSDTNYKTIAMSSESYNTKQGVTDSIKWTQVNAEVKTIDDLT